MPLLGLGKERLDPDLPLADRLLVGLNRVIAPDFLEIVDGERALLLAAMVPGRARGLDRQAPQIAVLPRYATTPSVWFVE